MISLRPALLLLLLISMTMTACSILPPPPSSAAKFVRVAVRPEKQPTQGQVSGTTGITRLSVSESERSYITGFHTEANWSHTLSEHYTLATGVQNGVVLAEGLLRAGDDRFNIGVLHGIGGFFSRDSREGFDPEMSTMLHLNAGVFGQLQVSDRGYLFVAARYSGQRFKQTGDEAQWLRGAGGSIGFLSETSSTLTWGLELGYTRHFMLDENNSDPFSDNAQIDYNLLNALLTVRADVL